MSHHRKLLTKFNLSAAQTSTTPDWSKHNIEKPSARSTDHIKRVTLHAVYRACRLLIVCIQKKPTAMYTAYLLYSYSKQDKKAKEKLQQAETRRGGPNCSETAQSNCVHKVWINKINVWIKDCSSSELNTSNIHNRMLFPEMGERENEV